MIDVNTLLLGIKVDVNSDGESSFEFCEAREGAVIPISMQMNNEDSDEGQLSFFAFVVTEYLGMVVETSDMDLIPEIHRSIIMGLYDGLGREVLADENLVHFMAETQELMSFDTVSRLAIQVLMALDVH